MKRTFLRGFFRFALIFIILWAFVQSCTWLGEVTDANEKHYNSYPYYNQHYNQRKINEDYGL